MGIYEFQQVCGSFQFFGSFSSIEYQICWQLYSGIKNFEGNILGRVFCLILC